MRREGRTSGHSLWRAHFKKEIEKPTCDGAVGLPFPLSRRLPSFLAPEDGRLLASGSRDDPHCTPSCTAGSMRPPIRAWYTGWMISPRGVLGEVEGRGRTCTHREPPACASCPMTVASHLTFGGAGPRPRRHSLCSTRARAKTNADDIDNSREATRIADRGYYHLNKNGVAQK